MYCRNGIEIVVKNKNACITNDFHCGSATITVFLQVATSRKPVHDSNVISVWSLRCSGCPSVTPTLQVKKKKYK